MKNEENYFSSIFSPNELQIAEITNGSQKSYKIVLTKSYSNKKEIQNKIASYALFHAKATEDGDIAASLEDMVKEYENKSLDESISLEKQMAYSEILSDLNCTLYHPKRDDKKLVLGR